MTDSIFFSVSGGPNCPYIFKDFRERGYEVHAGDMSSDNMGPHLSDHFVKLPRQDDDDYFNVVHEYIDEHEIDYFVPLVGEEALGASKQRDRFEENDCTLVAANRETLEYSIDTDKLLSRLEVETDIPIMEYETFDSAPRFEEALDSIQAKRLCVKPAAGAGTRGFVILRDEPKRAEDIFSSKFQFQELTREYVLDALQKSSDLPKLLLMEFLDDYHFDSNMICRNGKILHQSVKTREASVNGTITRGEIVDEPELEKINQKIASTFNTTGLISTQFIGNKLIEINPRWSTSLNHGKINEYLMGLKIFDDNDPIPDELNDYEGTRMIRYWDIHVFQE